MYIKNKYKKGDISLLVTLLVCSIILILLAPLAQKVSVESKISRENLMSQQAVQAAKTGLDAWLYNFVNSTGAPSDIPVTTLDSTLGIQYQVEFIPKIGSTPARIKSTGRVNRGGVTIERTLEEAFKSIIIVSAPTPAPCSPVSFAGVTSRSPFDGGWGKQVFVLDRSVGITAPWSDFMLDNAISFRVSNAQNAVDSASTTFFAPGTGTYTVKAASDNASGDGSTGNGDSSVLTVDGKIVNLGNIYIPQTTSIYINGPKTVTIDMTIGNGIEGGNDFLANPMGMAFTITADNLINCQ